jgi:hypothetical protein
MRPLCDVLLPPGVSVLGGGAKDARAGRSGAGGRGSLSPLPSISPLPSSRLAAPPKAVVKAQTTRTLGSLEKEKHFEWTVHTSQVGQSVRCPPATSLADARRLINRQSSRSLCWL